MTATTISQGVMQSPKPSRAVLAQVPLFTRALAGLIEGGVPLDKALSLAGETLSDKRFTPISEGLALAVRQGDSLSEACAKADQVWGKLFGPAFLALVRAGEASGHLADILAGQATSMERLGKVQRDLASALIYPALLAGVTLLSLFIIIGVVLPRLEGLFLGLGGEVPLAARVLIGLGEWSVIGGPIVLGLLIVVVFWIVSQRRVDQGRLKQDRVVLGMPVVGDLVMQLDMQRFCRSFAALVSGGLAIPQALELAGQSCRNKSIEAAVLQCQTRVSAGLSLGEAMAEQAGSFPPVLVQFAHLGLEAKQLAKLFDHYAGMAEDAIDVKAKRLIAVLEPGLVLTIGLVMAMIILALFQAILGLNQALI